ncbi:MAG: hypothetical protein KDA05_07610 [Phycisphaerales bacterium]|nr:hypothetical protein [Phycisphaerales bacterium]
MRLAAMVLWLSGCAGVAWAQSAHIVVTHDDPDGLVDPGQIVRINLRVSWTFLPLGWRLSSVEGDAAASPDLGVASNPGTALNFGNPTAHVSLGVPVLGSIRGFRFGQASGPVLVPGSSNAEGLDFLWYDWEAPVAPGAYAFNFDYDPQTQGVWLLREPNTYMKAALTTEAAFLTVVPAPGALAVFGAGAACWRRRRAMSA